MTKILSTRWSIEGLFRIALRLVSDGTSARWRRLKSVSPRGEFLLCGEHFSWLDWYSLHAPHQCSCIGAVRARLYVKEEQ